MARRKLTLMISSRCKTNFPLGDTDGVILSTIRKEIKAEIQQEKFLGKPLIDVWINEEETEDGSQTSWDVCIKKASDCDIFIALLDGSAGWQKDKSGIGICHAEFQTAHSEAPGKVRAISLAGENSKLKLKLGPDQDFHNAVLNANLLERRGINSVDDLKQKVKEVVREQVLQIAHEGSRETKKSGNNTGQALDWARLNFRQRQAEMSSTLDKALRQKAKITESEADLLVPIDGTKIFFVPTAIPAAFSVPAAREMVGQPFLFDHQHVAKIGKLQGGPVHIIGCAKGISEAQAMGVLGFPDATIVSGTYGVYVADEIQKIQMCFIPQCRDAAGTRHGMQRLFEWLVRTGEIHNLKRRAVSRGKIIKAIAAESENQ